MKIHRGMGLRAEGFGVSFIPLAIRDVGEGEFYSKSIPFRCARGASRKALQRIVLMFLFAALERS
jgi:hypothetical protein